MNVNRKKLEKVTLVSVLIIISILLVPGFDAVCILLLSALALDMVNFVTSDDEQKMTFGCLNCKEKLSIKEIPVANFEVSCEKCGFNNVFIRVATENAEPPCIMQ